MGVGNRFAKARGGWCARAWAKTLTNGGRSRGQAAVRVEEEADGWDLPVSVSQREEEGGSDERDPPVSDRVRGESARAAPVWASLRAIWLGLSQFQIVFLFSFSI